MFFQKESPKKISFIVYSKLSITCTEIIPKTDTKNRTIRYLNDHGETKPHELARFLEISSQALFRHLKTLI